MIFRPCSVNGVKIALFQRGDTSGDGVSFVASCSGEDMWGTNDTSCSVGAEQMFCFRKDLCRTEWAGIAGYENHSQAVSDFKAAIDEFNSDNFSHPVTQHLLRLMQDSIDIQKVPA